MAIRTHRQMGRDAVELARVRMPELAPESLEVVELSRDRTFVIVYLRTSGIVVLDRKGRLVRGRERLVPIGKHLRHVQQVSRALDEARLAQRCDHVELSLTLLDRLAPRYRGACAVGLQTVADSLAELGEALDSVVSQWQRGLEAPPTERTLRRTVLLLNEAAAADRAAVRAVRELGALLQPDPQSAPADKLVRWVVARLASPDLPFFMDELAAADCEQYGITFARAARV
jgi:hypothetical protein